MHAHNTNFLNAWNLLELFKRKKGHETKAYFMNKFDQTCFFNCIGDSLVHRQTHSILLSLLGLSIGVMICILYKLYFLFPNITENVLYFYIKKT